MGSDAQPSEIAIGCGQLQGIACEQDDRAIGSRSYGDRRNAHFLVAEVCWIAT